ncbi:NACHT domain-containing protein [Rahnella aceris]|jgi:hypothetical protein
MADSYDLTQLDTHTFEHLVNFLALKVLGNGVTGFAAGADGGRDGYLVGKACYPTPKENWEGTWYLQSKFHKPNLSKNPQTWLLQQIKDEIAEFENSEDRNLPDNWIIATNIEPTGKPQTGSFDKIHDLVKKKFGDKIKIDIWGGRRILDFLAHDEDASRYYGHFITPGHVISALYDNLKNKSREIKYIIDHLIISQFNELIYTKLEQAGSGSDQRPKIYELYEDLPVSFDGVLDNPFIMKSLVSSSCNVHKASAWEEFGDGWRVWSKIPSRARTILLKGGPGQGKSTAGQYFSQIQKAAFILSGKGPKVTPQIKSLATELKKHAELKGYWPSLPRVPVFIELKDYANWYNTKLESDSKSITAFICDKIYIRTTKKMTTEMFEESLRLFSWFINFDGLDEVPNDLKDTVAEEIILFTNEVCPYLDADVLILCTTRPQGYSGQFENLDAAVVVLDPLPPEIALSCASSVVTFSRDKDEGLQFVEVLKSAMESEQVRELMTTPLQSHIMAVVVRDGGRPPERRWELFNNFYHVMKRRESLKNFPDKKISQLLRENDVLLKSIHDRLGVSLHTKAEKSNGAEATLDKTEFKILAEKTTKLLLDGDINAVVKTLMEATTDRLVFVNTPESSSTVRFDIRQLQEFFAAEFIYSAVTSKELHDRLTLIGADSHWREVVHFILSALTYNKRVAELAITIDILSNLDSHPNHKIKQFKKRSATGALLALRLLTEGVLEQDRQVRLQFVKVFQPLWGTLDYQIIYRVLAVNHNQSKSWLVSVMSEAVMELDYSENITSGYLLTFMLTEQHPRFEEVKNKIITAPKYYLNTILAMSAIKNYYLPGINESKAQKWFICELVNILMSSDSLDIVTCNNALNVLRQEKSSLIQYLDSEGGSSNELDLLLYLVRINDKPIKTKNPQENKISYCFGDIVYHDHSWVTDTIPSGLSVLKTSDVKNSILLEMIKLIIIFSKKRDMDSLLLFIEKFESVGLNSLGIPSDLKALMPIDFEITKVEKCISTLKGMNDSDLSDILTHHKIKEYKFERPVKQARINDKPFNKISWRKLCCDQPFLAIQLWSTPFHNMDREFEYNSLDALNPILEIFEESPNLTSCCFLMWGEVFKAFPERESLIRKKLINNSISKRDFSGHFHRKTTPFKIDLENELEFIILFSHSLHTIQSLYLDHAVGMIHQEKIDYNETVLQEFGLSSEILLHICNDASNSNLVRIAALSCYLGQTFEDKNLIIDNFFKTGLNKTFCSLLNKGDNENLISGIYGLFLDIKHLDDDVMEFIGEVTYICKEHFRIKFVLQSLYSRWRERSSSPVQKSNKIDEWLDYTYNI